jgi:hypothetical protein
MKSSAGTRGSGDDFCCPSTAAHLHRCADCDSSTFFGAAVTIKEAEEEEKSLMRLQQAQSMRNHSAKHKGEAVDEGDYAQEKRLYLSYKHMLAKRKKLQERK